MWAKAVFRAVKPKSWSKENDKRAMLAFLCFYISVSLFFTIKCFNFACEKAERDIHLAFHRVLSNIIFELKTDKTA